MDGSLAAYGLGAGAPAGPSRPRAARSRARRWWSTAPSTSAPGPASSTPSTPRPASALDLPGARRHQGQRRAGRPAPSWWATTPATSTPSTRARAPSGGPTPAGGASTAGPAVSGDTIVIGDVGGAVIALDARDRRRALAPLHRRGVRLLEPGDRRRRRLHRLLQRRLPGARPGSGRGALVASTSAARISGSATVVDGVVYTAAPLRARAVAAAPTGSTPAPAPSATEADDGRYSPAVAAGRTLYLVGTRTSMPIPRPRA